MIRSTFSMDSLRVSVRLCAISAWVRLRSKGATSSTAYTYSCLTYSYLCDLSASNLACDTKFVSSARSRSSGSRSSSPESVRLLRSACLRGAVGSGRRVPAKGMSLPLPTFLKSSRRTPLGSALTILIISCTSSCVNSSPMQRRKKARSSKERVPSLLMSITWKASRISSSEYWSRLISQPVVSAVKGFLWEMLFWPFSEWSSSSRPEVTTLAVPSAGALILMVQKISCLLPSSLMRLSWLPMPEMPEKDSQFQM